MWPDVSSDGEPMVHGARLDVSAEAMPRLMAVLWRTRTLLFQHVVAVAGPDLTGAEGVGSLLGIRYTQAAEGVLRLWRNRLSMRERCLLEDYGQGTEPDSEDPFPEIRLAAHLGNLDGPLLRPAKTFSLVAVDKKTLYNNCVRVLNRRGLSNRSTSVWADRLGWSPPLLEGPLQAAPEEEDRGPPVEDPIWGCCPELSYLQNEHCCVGPVPVLPWARDCIPCIH
ncbi:uncharacterized protein [Takifugu rubripes]|uniref:uncharacterized protein n=1 Tax=Takifugu rubripes TaxID=31033 RepID=UPI001145BBA7|nr:uncharacterized protein LOC115249915 [Takifugu rubripes]